jgi:hypothetical protein
VDEKGKNSIKENACISIIVIGDVGAESDLRLQSIKGVKF